LAPTSRAIIISVAACHYETVGIPHAATDRNPDADAQQVLADAPGQAFGDGLPSGLRSICVPGQPAQALLELGDAVQLIVVGSRGHDGFAGLLSGSVSSACAGYATLSQAWCAGPTQLAVIS
jgi:nucleotide-binding universal stress UspA family protein